MAPTSLPASGSDEQNAPSLTSPGSPNICGSHSAICSSVPLPATAMAASPLPASDSPIPASPQNSSSNATAVPRPLGSNHCWAKKSRSEEHTSELQSQFHLVCRLLLE